MDIKYHYIFIKRKKKKKIVNISKNKLVSNTNESGNKKINS